MYFVIAQSFICRCRIQRKDGDLVVCPDKIVCENLKEAEHLASTLALYELCKGQVCLFHYPLVSIPEDTNFTKISNIQSVHLHTSSSWGPDLGVQSKIHPPAADVHIS